MAWIKIQAGLVTNKKTARLAGLMKWKKLEAVGFLVSFWIWALENCEDGQLRDISDNELAFAVGMEKADGILAALKNSGLVDSKPLRIHEWPDHQNDYLRSKYRKSPEKHAAIIDQYRTSTAPVPDISRVEIEIGRVERVEKKQKERAGAPFVLPDWINPTTWAAYIDTRKKKRAAQTSHALSLIIEDLEKLKTQGYDPKVVLENSVKCGWAGVFPPRDFNDKKRPVSAAAPIPGKYDGIGSKA